MEILQNYDLAKLNTFGVSAKAEFFVQVETEQDFLELLQIQEFKNNKRIFLGGGSNVLFTSDFAGIVILNKLKGIEIVEENAESVLVRAKSGEVWHDLVTFATERGLWGIENLAFIPGTVGGAPMQNIGAYGVEIKDVIENVEVKTLSKASGNKRIFKKDECEFSYRDSIFKNSSKDKYFITSITLKLSKIPKPNLSYKILKEYLDENKITVRNSKDVADAVTQIRKSKLPDPKVIGNVGSFFKNVFVTPEELKELQKTYPEMPFFEEISPARSKASGWGKIPAGWLIEQCGWKGKRVGNVGVHDKQALVIVNHGGASGKEIKDLAEWIIKDVKEKFDLELVPEVNFVS